MGLFVVFILREAESRLKCSLASAQRDADIPSSPPYSLAKVREIARCSCGRVQRNTNTADGQKIIDTRGGIDSYMPYGTVHNTNH